MSSNSNTAFPKLLVLLLFINSVTSLNLFREYIGAEFNGVKFTDVPISPGVDFHFILSFAADYTKEENPSPTDGDFNIFWDSNNLTPEAAASIKTRHANVKIGVSLGGASVNNAIAFFQPKSVSSWVNNAVSSLREIIRHYHIDGIDIDYENFHADPETFAECIGQLITTLKSDGTITFVSIAPFEDPDVQRHYLALWRKYGHAIDYVNFQFYAYYKIGVSQFLNYFRLQEQNYHGGRVLASFSTDGDGGGLGPDNGFFKACEELKKQGRLGGIFVWSSDDSKKFGFRYEVLSQQLLASH
ncbi:hypothetical protein QJS10_CPA09g01811 [Acorus calamus]|uniref:GH18 domain-containing protein n=1 Tax=Acorus calamus TaxID=4465 RepID=A0AAV9E5M6_ACOCL|nr:hypothetical protein QJS10_CPA09g01811 [Acorus calamus]